MTTVGAVEQKDNKKVFDRMPLQPPQSPMLKKRDLKNSPRNTHGIRTLQDTHPSIFII